MQEQKSITETSYPITSKWVFKMLLIFLGFAVILDAVISLKSIGGPIYILHILFGFLTTVGFVYSILRKNTFHYIIESNFLTIKQGIISKQTRHLPFGVIQNIFVNQDIFDKILGIASITIENASHNIQANTATANVSLGQPGFFGNSIHIPGLSTLHAQDLKNIILQKIKEHPLEDSQSGL